MDQAKTGILKPKHLTESKLADLKKEIVELESRGYTCREAARRLGLTYNKYKYLYLRRKLGLPTRTRGIRNEREVVEEMRRVIEERGGKYCYAELARMSRLNYMTVRRLVLKYKLPAPTHRPMKHGLFRNIISDEELARAISIISDMYALSITMTRLPDEDAVAVEKAIKLLENVLRLRASEARTRDVLGDEPIIEKDEVVIKDGTSRAPDYVVGLCGDQHRHPHSVKAV